MATVAVAFVADAAGAAVVLDVGVVVVVVFDVVGSVVPQQISEFQQDESTIFNSKFQPLLHNSG